MPARIVVTSPTPSELEELLSEHSDYIKLAVDVETGIVAAGGKMHADCEDILLEKGSQQDDVWGADWVPSTKLVRYESLINIRPRLGNRSSKVQSEDLRRKIEQAVREVFDK